MNCLLQNSFFVYWTISAEYVSVLLEWRTWRSSVFSHMSGNSWKKLSSCGLVRLNLHFCKNSNNLSRFLSVKEWNVLVFSVEIWVSSVRKYYLSSYRFVDRAHNRGQITVKLVQFVICHIITCKWRLRLTCVNIRISVDAIWRHFLIVTLDGFINAGILGSKIIYLPALFSFKDSVF